MSIADPYDVGLAKMSTQNMANLVIDEGFLKAFRACVENATAVKAKHQQEVQESGIQAARAIMDLDPEVYLKEVEPGLVRIVESYWHEVRRYTDFNRAAKQTAKECSVAAQAVCVIKEGERSPVIQKERKRLFKKSR